MHEIVHLCNDQEAAFLMNDQLLIFVHVALSNMLQNNINSQYFL